MQGWSTHKHPIGLEVHGQLQMHLVGGFGGIHMLQTYSRDYLISRPTTLHVRTRWKSLKTCCFRGFKN